MVLESLVNPLIAERRPFNIFFLGFVYATVGVFLSLWIFKQYSSLIMVFLTVMTAIPLMYSTLKYEEEKDLVIDEEVTLLKEHGKALTFLLFMFLGFAAAFTLWYVALPKDLTVTLFQSQIQTITTINTQIMGQQIQPFNAITRIFFNNVKVLTFCILFAFIYGLGAIFILTWNASVIGAATGNFIRSQVSHYALSAGMVNTGTYLKAVSMSFLRYFIHGIPEMAAYFIGGMAGGIISMAIIRKHYKTPKFEKIIFDSSELIVLSLLVLIIAAFIEVYVTPIFF